MGIFNSLCINFSIIKITQNFFLEVKCAGSKKKNSAPFSSLTSSIPVERKSFGALFVCFVFWHGKFQNKWKVQGQFISVPRPLLSRRHLRKAELSAPFPPGQEQSFQCVTSGPNPKPTPQELSKGSGNTCPHHRWRN